MKKQVVLHRNGPFGKLMYLLFVLFLVNLAPADTLEMKNGTILNGTYMGGTQHTVRFQTGNGLQALSAADVLALTFTSASQPQQTKPVPAPPAAPAAPAPAPAAPKPASVTIPAGTFLLVATTSPLNSKSPSGQRFSTKLAQNLFEGGTLIAPKGTLVYGRVGKASQAGRMAGSSELELYLTDIELNGRSYPLMTTNFKEKGKSSFHKTARNTGLGALIGHAVDDDGGGKTGALIGLGVSALRSGEAITIKPGTVLEFRMTQPLTVTP